MVFARRELLKLGGAALAWRLVLIARRSGADSPAEAFAELEQRTRDHQEALRRLQALQEDALARATVVAERYRTLLGNGLVSRREVEEAEQAVTSARERLAETQGQLASAERIAVEAQGLASLAALPPAPPGEEQSTPEVLEYRGVTPWTLAQVATLDQFFEAKFKRPLPVSALGQTPLHDLLRFDHRNAADVAVHPDSIEGRALIGYLRAQGIPFLAFRGPVAGASTGAHVHVGHPSPRLG